MVENEVPCSLRIFIIMMVTFYTKTILRGRIIL